MVEEAEGRKQNLSPEDNSFCSTTFIPTSIALTLDPHARSDLNLEKFTSSPVPPSDTQRSLSPYAAIRPSCFAEKLSYCTIDLA
ncbi:hypothetical protein RRG08_009137 [Elysia crispata]|uniref:Uncharacterized protein n=1 Tax=Elysia crispata TaxID=231223 RepID=A0AAE0YQ31_9GAST|nr:hypothetical protein RRG08_009137 [Elysia crispata]